MKEKKLTKKLMSILLILVSIAVIIIAFVGIYLPKLNKLKNIIPDYKLGTEIDGIIEYRLSVDDSSEDKQVYVDSEGNIKGVVKTDTSTSAEETTDGTTEETINDTGYSIETKTILANEESSLTEANFEKSKRIIEQRLEEAGATEYAIRMDDLTGELVVELSENDNVQFLYEVAINSQGKFEILDDQTGVVLIDRTQLKTANEYTYYDQSTNSYTVYLQVTLTDEGASILRDISKKYVQYTDESGTTQTEKISIQIDGSAIMTTYFGEEYTEATLNIPVGQNITTQSDVNSYVDSVTSIANTLNNEQMPIKYKLNNNNALFIQSSIGKDMIKVYTIILATVLVIITVILTVKYHKKGCISGILNIALISLLILVLKYVKVTISISSLIAIYGVVVMNLILVKMYLNKLMNKEENAYLETLKKYYSIMFPIIVVAFIFTFFVSTTVTGMGSVLFWGLLLQIIYNTFVLKYVIEDK